MSGEGPPLPAVPEHGAAVPDVPGAPVAPVGRRWRRDVPNSRPLPDWVRRLAWVLDDAFAVPGMPGRRVGVDGLIAFVPVIGDAAGIVLAAVIVVAGAAAGVSVPTLLRMLLNVGIEAVAGLVPVLGAVFDMAYKANNRNVALIEADLADRSTTRRSSLRVLVMTVIVIVVLLAMLVAVVVGVIALLVWLLSRWF